jgi:hypothetical protein
MSAINRRNLIGGLALAAATITFVERKFARGEQVGTSSEVNWFNYGKAFYSPYLDIVLRTYESDFEKDRMNTNVALHGGWFGERKGYLKWYMTFDPNNLPADERPQNRANRRLEVFSKIKTIRDANVRDEMKFKFFDELIKLTFPKEDLIRRVLHPGDIPATPVMLSANSHILWELYQTKIPNDRVSSAGAPSSPPQ